MLINMTAVWTLNSFDNFSYFSIEKSLRKNYMSVLKDENFMKIEVTQTHLDITTYWVKMIEALLLLFFIFDNLSVSTTCKEEESVKFWENPASYKAPTPFKRFIQLFSLTWLNIFYLISALSFLIIPFFKYMVIKYRTDGLFGCFKINRETG